MNNNDRVRLENELNGLFSCIFHEWEFADSVIGNKSPEECRNIFVSTLIVQGQGVVALSNWEGSYVRTFKVIINNGFAIDSIFEMECDPWNPEADIDNNYYYHQDVSWKKIYSLLG